MPIPTIGEVVMFDLDEHAAEAEERWGNTNTYREPMRRTAACTPEIQAGLGTMCAADERCRANIDEAGEELAGYLSAAIAARYVP